MCEPEDENVMKTRLTKMHKGRRRCRRRRTEKNVLANRDSINGTYESIIRKELRMFIDMQLISNNIETKSIWSDAVGPIASPIPL